MHIEERLEHFIATMVNTETVLKVFLYVVAILLAYNYFFYLTLVGLVVGIPLYYYIQTNGIRSIEDFHVLVRPKNTVVEPTPTTTTATTPTPPTPPTTATS
jgi:hypothetical protein